MSEKKLNSILYIILAIVVMLYLYFNVFVVGSPVMTLNDRQGKAESEGKETKNTGLMETEFKDTELKEAESIEIETKEAESSESKTQEDDLREAEFKQDQSSAELQEKSSDQSRNINPDGYHIYVDLDLTQMFVYKDGELIKTYEVSGGKASSPSPTGTWRIINKDTWGEGFGGAWLGFNVPWGMYGIHGTTEPWSVGNSNISKGCIRMKNTDVRELYKLVPYNTVVTIVYENSPFYPMKDGDVGSDVLEVEKALKRLGYYNGSEDGIFGEVLVTAVKKFQKENKLYKTGVVNISTYERIMEMAKELEE